METVILVEGESDKAALAAAAQVRGDDLSNVAILVMNGATNVVRFLTEALVSDLRVTGLYDAAEEVHMVRALATAGLTEGRDPASVQRLGFFRCDPDLEAELIRAIGADRIIEVIAQQGNDLRRFRKLQQMPEWRGRPVEHQLRRWFGSGSRRKVRYAALLAGTLDAAEVPPPLAAVLEHALGS